MTDPSAPGAGHAPKGGDMPEELPYRELSGLPLVASCVLTVIAVLVVMNQLLNLQLFAGIVFVDNRYL
jgi:hypothetical protein